MADLESIKREVALANRMLAATGLVGGVSAALGHVSCRIPDDPDHFVIKGLWKPLAQAGAGDMLVVDMNGFKTEGPRALNLPNEVKMHSCILRERPEVNSVVHCHPRFAVMMSVLELPLTPMRIEGMQLLARPLPVFPSPRLIIREEDGAEVAQLIGDSPAILLRGHGVATAGKSMEDALIAMLQIEEQAMMNYHAACVGGLSHKSITPEQMREFGENMQRVRQQEHLQPWEDWTPQQPGGVWQYYAALAGDEP